MSLSYDSRKLVPAPTITLNKTYRTSEDGAKLGTQYDITLHGTLLPFRGSPSGHYDAPENAFWMLSGDPPDEGYQGNNEDFNSLLRKQEAIRWLFSRDGRSLEWQPAYGQPVVKCNPRVTNVNFVEGQWADRCDYIVELQADFVYINGQTSYEDAFASGLITSATDSWSFDEITGREGQFYQVSHTVTANGLLGYDETGSPLGGKQGWQHAKDWVDAHASGVVDPEAMRAAVGQDTWLGGSYTKNFVINKSAGTYQVVETWIIAPVNYYIEKSFSVEYDSTTNEYRVRYDGTVQGLANGRRSGSPEAMANAKAAIPTLDAARTEAMTAVADQLDGKTLGDYPELKTVALSQKEGTAAFSYQWSTSDNPKALVTLTANLAWNADAGLYTLSLSEEIVGLGTDSATKLANARAAILDDATARTRAIEIIGTQLPPGVTISNTLRAKSSAINERQGTANIAWTWDDCSDHNLDVIVTIRERGSVAAIIPIPGRPAGPIIQSMNTTNEKTGQVSIRGQNYTSRPSYAEMLNLAHSYLGVPVQGFLVTNPSESWNPVKKAYSLDVTYLILEGY